MLLHSSTSDEPGEGEIHLRDPLQFELKSAFLVYPRIKKTIYKEEIFIFIPSPLQINGQSYSKEQFYLDQTTLIRYKTPSLSLEELANINLTDSPLSHLQRYLSSSTQFFPLKAFSDELKLLGAIFRTSLRSRFQAIHHQAMKEMGREVSEEMVVSLCHHASHIRTQFHLLKEEAQRQLSHESSLMRQVRYIDEFMSVTLEHFLTLLLHTLRSMSLSYSKGEGEIFQIVERERHYRRIHQLGPKVPLNTPFSEETFLHRQGLLNRFVMEALQLQCQRFSLEETQGHLLGALAATLAGSVYVALLAWHNPGTVTYSLPILLLLVFFYVLKDRIKEAFKSAFYKQAHRWFPDYSTEIRSPRGVRIGRLNESASFVSVENLPEEIFHARRERFHEELQGLQRQESILQYKREVALSLPSSPTRRRQALTTLFRFNLHRFLYHASPTSHPSLSLDLETGEVSTHVLPKVYHLNVLIRTCHVQDGKRGPWEMTAVRLIIDRNGIKRIEKPFKR